MDDKRLISVIPAVRMISSIKERAVVRHSCNKEAIKSINSESWIYKNAVWVDSHLAENEFISTFKEKVTTIFQSTGKLPFYVFIDDEDVLIISENAKNALLLEEMLLIGSGFRKGNNLPESKESEILKKINVSEPVKPGKKACNKVVIVTGGAQGFGEGIVRDLFLQGANVVIADLNETKGMVLENELNNAGEANRAFYFKTDVTNSRIVEDLVTETVKQFGGIDVLISNAGILFAGSLDEMTPETFDLMTRVNYNGYFLCAKHVSKVMKIQSEHKENYFMDIIQINSKSGLRGSNKNFAYAGGKFGGIGLTQSFALELMPYRIKVNSICPGNFFEGPLWSDPEKGLFVQYLRAGKVPGAKTIEDVKRFYEKQVPANRGCRVEDVMKAIYYVIDQEYETGQAVPVTGGQVMLN